MNENLEGTAPVAAPAVEAPVAAPAEAPAAPAAAAPETPKEKRPYYYYAAHNPEGTEDHVVILRFTTKQPRNDWVAQHAPAADSPAASFGARPIKATDVYKLQAAAAKSGATLKVDIYDRKTF